MKAHVIENNKVVNTILVDSLDFMPNLIDGSTGAIGWDYIDGVLIPPAVDLEEERVKKLQALTNYTKSFLSAAMSDYSEWEAISWPLLIAEAEAYQKDGTIGEYMAAEIGVKYPDAESLALVILARKDAMKSLRAGVVLVRQTKEAAIENAETIEELNDVQIASGWPGQEA